MAWSIDSSTPPPVYSSNNSAATTFAGFSPPAGSKIIVFDAIGNATGSSTAQTGAVTWQFGGAGSFTLVTRKNGTTGQGAAEIWYCDLSTAPGSSAVECAAVDTTDGFGVMLAVFVVTGLKTGSGAIGATLGAASGNGSITPHAAGSFLGGAMSYSSTTVSLTLEANETGTTGTQGEDSGNGETYGYYYLTNGTVGTSAITVGFTLSNAAAVVAGAEFQVASSAAKILPAKIYSFPSRIRASNW